MKNTKKHENQWFSHFPLLRVGIRKWENSGFSVSQKAVPETTKTTKTVKNDKIADILPRFYTFSLSKLSFLETLGIVVNGVVGPGTVTERSLVPHDRALAGPLTAIAPTLSHTEPY